MKIILLKYICLVFLASLASVFLAGYGKNKIDIFLKDSYLNDQKDTISLNKQSQREKQQITSVVNAQFTALNSKNLAAYMNTIHPETPLYSSTRDLTSKIFETYDLKFEINRLELISISANEATIKLTQTTRKLRGPAFRDNRLIGIHTLRKYHSQWKFYALQIESIEYLN